MKTLTAEALKRKAMAMGAALEVNGQKFNVSRSKVTALPRPKTAKAPEEPPKVEEKEVDRSTEVLEHLAGATFLLCESNASVVEQIKAHLSERPSPVRHWSFEMVRNAKGDLIGIEAVAKES